MTDSSLESRFDFLNSSVFSVNYDMGQNILCYESPSSLECFTLTKLAVILWRTDDVLDDITQTIVSGSSIERFYRQNLPPIPKLFQKVSSLPLPKLCEEILKERIKLLGVELIKYLTFQKQFDSSLIDNIKLYWDNVCWTPQGTINGVKTASRLVQNANLSTMKKYIISCNYCLENSIDDLLKILPNDIMNDLAEEEKFKLVVFWTCQIKGEPEKFSQIISRDIGAEVNNNKYIFEWAIRNKNEVAVEYIWKSFSDEEMKENLVASTRDAMGRATFTDYARYINISCYLLSQFNCEQIEEICLRKGYLLLGLLTDDMSRWRCYLLSTTRYMLMYFRKMNIWDALEIVKICWKENIFEKDLYKRVLNDFLIIFKSDIKNNFVKICDLILNSLFAKQDIEAMESFLAIGSIQDRKRILCDTAGVKYCEDLITNGKLDLLHLFIVEMLTSKEEIKEFKKQFFKASNFNICFWLIMKDNYEVVDAFLQMFCPEERRKGLKSKLPLKEEAKIIAYILKWTAKKDTLQLSRIDTFLDWSFDGDLEKIRLCKAEVFDPERKEFADCKDRIQKRVSVLIKEGEWSIVEEYLKWTALTEDKIVDLKRNLACRKEISVKLTYDLILRGDNLNSFKRFVNFLPEDGVDVLKEDIKNSGKLIAVVRELQRRHKSFEVDDLLHWWFKSTKDLQKFKKIHHIK